MVPPSDQEVTSVSWLVCAAQVFSTPHGHEVGRAADVDARSMGMGNRQGCCTSLDGLEDDAVMALNHGLLHHSLRNVALHRVRRLAHSLKRDIDSAAACIHEETPPRRFTNVDDVTQDHANPRAVRATAASTLRSAAFELATTEPPEFLRRDLRQSADYFANLSFEHAAGLGRFVRPRIAPF